MQGKHFQLKNDKELNWNISSENILTGQGEREYLFVWVEQGETNPDLLQDLSGHFTKRLICKLGHSFRFVWKLI